MTAHSEQSVLVYDVGGSHVSAAVCSADGYRLGPVVSGRHPEQHSADAFIDLLCSLGTQASAAAKGVLGAGLAIPGPFDYAEGISRMRHKLPYLYGVDLRQALAQRFGWQPANVRFLNDAAAYLLGEIGAGAARGVPRAVGITLGTGIGSAFAVDGRVVTSGPGVPPSGEIWNLPYEGKTVEDFLSTRAIQENYRQCTGQQRAVSTIAAAAATDPTAAKVFTEFGRHLGLALRAVTSAFAPSVIVLGGGISRSSQLFLPAAELELRGMKLQVRISTLLDNAPLVGAGVAWFSNSCQCALDPSRNAAPAIVL
jgi:glucokinase